MEKKIFLEKNDGLEVAVEELIRAKSDVVVLNIPKDSVLGKSVNNFHVLKREGSTAGKTLMVESIDDHILEIASLAMITAINPVFNKQERSVSDILPRASVLLKKHGKKNKEDEDLESEKKYVKQVKEEVDSEKQEVVFRDIEHSKPHKKHIHKIKNYSVFWVVSIAVVLCLSIFSYVYWFVIPRGTVVVTLKQKSVTFDIPVSISQENAETKVTQSKIYLPGQLIVSQGSFSGVVGDASVSTSSARKAEGAIIITNAFSTAQQKLVATTRFETPDGKIFRLKSDTVVPGAKMVGGALKPSTVEALVIADQVGSEYNIGPVSKFTIPGFKGTPRFNSFYGESKADMSGGSNEVVSSGAEANAEGKDTEESITNKLKTALKEKTHILDSAELKIFDEARQFIISKRDMQSTPSGTVLYLEGSLKEIGFREGDMKEAIYQYYKNEVGADMRVRSLHISYETSTPNFVGGSISTVIHGEVVFEADVDTDKIFESILGKNKTEASNSILAVPGVESASIEVSPKWANTRVPGVKGKINFQIK